MTPAETHAAITTINARLAELDVQRGAIGAEYSELLRQKDAAQTGLLAGFLEAAAEVPADKFSFAAVGAAMDAKAADAP
jgi:hypothetical protein